MLQYLFYLWTATMLACVMTPAGVLSTQMLPPFLIAVGVFSALDGQPILGAGLAVLGFSLELFFRPRNNRK